MKEPRWIELEDAGKWDKKKIHAQFALPSGHVFEGTGELWVRNSAKPDRVAITCVLEDGSGYPTIKQYRFYLSKDQTEKIVPSVNTEYDLEYKGILTPDVLIE